jgi:hypothetical protein
MAILPNIKQLLIPRKTAAKAHPGYKEDMQQLEVWARQPIQQLVAGSNITLTPANGLATDSKGNGPQPITIAATGGGGGVTHITSPQSSITVTGPFGPTTGVDVAGRPFLPYGDTNSNVGYGPNVFGIPPSGGPGSNDSAFGNQALQDLTTGIHNTGLGAAAGLHDNTGSENTFVGYQAGTNVNSGLQNVAVGSQAGYVETTSQNNTTVGYHAQGPGSTGLLDNITCIGSQTNCHGSGGVAIGMDHFNTAASAPNVDDFALGTANHVIVFSNTATGTTTCTLGANGPSVGTTPRGWIKIRDSAGAIGYVPYFV